MLEELGNTIEELLKEFKLNDIDVVVIGSTVISLELGAFLKENEDLDFFVTNRSPFLEEDLFKNIALLKGWDYAYTDYGTPRFIIPREYGEIFVDFYENIHDFYVPQKLLEKETRLIRIGEGRLKVISVEAYIVLKARAGRKMDDNDLNKIKELVDDGYLKISKRKIRELLKLFPVEEISTMRNRLLRRKLIEK